MHITRAEISCRIYMLIRVFWNVKVLLSNVRFPLSRSYYESFMCEKL